MRMIFVTAGTQEPFDRLVRAIDEYVGSHNTEIVVQALKGRYTPVNFELLPLLESKEFDLYMTRADVIVGHAGMGTILKSIEMGKPLIIMPRHKTLGEHRTDHQQDTVKRLPTLPNIRIVQNRDELFSALDEGAALLNAGTVIKPDFSCVSEYIARFIGLNDNI